MTYDIDPDALAALVPDWMEPDLLVLADGRRRALVSAVSFRDVDFRFRLLPFVRLGMLQTNYRAYVRAGGERAVWFVGSTLTSRSVAIPRRLWSMPWHRVDGTLEVSEIDAASDMAVDAWRIDARGVPVP